MFKKILEDKQSYTMNDEERNMLFNTPNLNYHYQQHHSSKRMSHNVVDETGSLISDYTEDDLDIIDNEDEINIVGAAAAPLSDKKSARNRNITSTASPFLINSSIGRRSKRQKGSLTRQDNSEKKRSRTRSHDVSKK